MEELTPYEKTRLEAKKKNLAVLASMNIREQISSLVREQEQADQARRRSKPKRRHTLPAYDQPLRKSPRLQGLTPVSLKDEDPAFRTRRSSADRDRPAKRRRRNSVRDDLGVSTGDYETEAYTEEHVAALGTCKTVYPWKENGLTNKVYDPVRGTCCHQCRQKTLDVKTTCTECESMSGYFCGMCLQLRYGENLREVLDVLEAGGGWKCPSCRNLCNCSMCRGDRGLRATGILAPRIIKEFPSVAHFLVHKYPQDAATLAAYDARFPPKKQEDEEEQDSTPKEECSEVPTTPAQEERTQSPTSDSEDKENQALIAVSNSPVRKEESDDTEDESDSLPAAQEPHKKKRAPRTTNKKKAPTQEAEPEVFVVEKILDVRETNGAKEYHVAWLGYDSEHNTWEPEENCAGCPVEIQSFWNRRRASAKATRRTR